MGSLEAHIIQCVHVRTLGLGVLNELHTEPFGIAEPGIVIGCRADDIRRELRARGQGNSTRMEVMRGQNRLISCKEVVQGQPDFERQGAGDVRPYPEAHQLSQGGKQAIGPVENRNGGGERPHIVGSVLDQAISLPQGFPDQAKFAILEVAQPAVHDARRGGTGARTEIGFFRQNRVHPLQSQFAEQANTIDPAPHNQD